MDIQIRDIGRHKEITVKVDNVCYVGGALTEDEAKEEAIKLLDAARELLE